MRWSFKIARVAGIDIRVHITFFLIVFLFAGQWAHHGLRGIIFGTVMVLLLFLCVTLHELGHSVVAQSFGVTVKQILLLPIGGVAMLTRMPSTPAQELWVALAGPAVNVVIAAGIFLGTGLTLVAGTIDFAYLVNALRQEPSVQMLIVWLFLANVALVVFNMIPAFPLDGGRVLRALLAMGMPRQRATAIAATIGQTIAILLFMLGLMTGPNWILVIIAAFIFLGAGAEAAEGQTRGVLATRAVGDAYNEHAITLSPYDRLSTVIRHILTSYQPDFAVVNGRDILGVVTRQDVVEALSQHSGDVTVEQLMKPAALRVSAWESLDEVRQKMSEQESRVAAVYAGDRYLGLVSAEDIAEAFALLRFLEPEQSREGGVVV
jgi:Zn-dependent protease